MTSGCRPSGPGCARSRRPGPRIRSRSRIRPRSTDLPVRLLLIVPLDDIAATDAEELALKLLGSDPSPRTLVALVAVGSGVGPGPAPRRLDAFARTLPAALGRHPDVRFLDLRAEMLSFGHPRTGLTRLTGDDGHHWPEAFVRDLVAHLAQVEIFDAVWSTVPADRPATVGMRIASLGEGRERAVADLALRLSRELDPAGEPSMASQLPEAVGRRSAAAARPGAVPAARRLRGPGAARRSRAGERLPRRAVPAAVAAARGLQRGRAHGHRGAGGSAGRAFPIAARGAADAARARPGSTRSAPRSWTRRSGASCSATSWPSSRRRATIPRRGSASCSRAPRSDRRTGVSVSLLADWLRSDARRVEPEGPAAAAERLVDGDRPWARLASDLNRQRRRSPTRPRGSWARCGAHGAAGGRVGRRRRPVIRPRPRRPPGERPAPDLGGPARPALVRRRARLAIAVALVHGRARDPAARARHRPDLRQPDRNLPGQVVDPNVLGVPLREWQTIGMLLAVAFVVYVLLGFAVALALRRWGSRFRFGDVPELGEPDRRRGAGRRDRRGRAVRGAQATTRAWPAPPRTSSSTGRSTAPRSRRGSASGSAPSTRPRPTTTCPACHRTASSSPPTQPSLAGTDAGGIYRVYPLYVSALRTMFSEALVRAIRERWPRIRGVFWAETEGSIIAATSAVLERRLDEILEFGLRRGELAEEGVDPADDLAERLWANAAIRERALRSLHLDPSDPMPLLATPADTRLLDQTAASDLIVAIPPTLEPLIRPNTDADGVQVITSSVLETAAAIRIFAFQPGSTTSPNRSSARPSRSPRSQAPVRLDRLASHERGLRGLSMSRC